MEHSSLQLALPLWELTGHIGSLTYLPTGIGDISAFIPAKLLLDVPTPEDCKVELTYLAGFIPRCGSY